MSDNGSNGGLNERRATATMGVPGDGADSRFEASRREDADSGALREYFGVLWRRKWIILMVAFITTASAFGLSYRQAKVYQASADLTYEPDVNLSNPFTGVTSATSAADRMLQLISVKSMLLSPGLRQRAGVALQAEGEAPTGFAVTSAPVVDPSLAGTSAIANVVRITVTSGSPRLAAAAANAYAVTYVDFRKENAKQQVQRAINAITSKMATYAPSARSGADYLVLQQRLLDLQLMRSTATGNFSVLVPATVPTSPVSPKPFRSAALGFVIGLVVGIGLAFLLDQLDTRLRGTDDLVAILKRPIIGSIPRVPSKVLKDGAVTAMVHPAGQVAEAFRLVRTNLDFLSVDDDIRSVLLTSCLQGEGKSSAVANLGVTMALSGKKIIIVDADLRRPRQHAYFGLGNSVGLSTVVTGQDELFDALHCIDVGGGQTDDAPPDFDAWVKAPDAGARLWVIPSGPIPPNPGEIVASGRFAEYIRQLTEVADLVLVDTPAMLPVGDSPAIARAVDGLIFLVDLSVVKKPQLQSAADQLFRLPAKTLGIIIRGSEAGGRYGYSYSYRSGYSYSDGGKRRFGRTRPAADDAAAAATVTTASAAARSETAAGVTAELSQALQPAREVKS